MGKGMSLIGTLYAGLLDADRMLVGGYRKIGNAYPFSLKVTTAQKSQISRLRESAGSNLHTKTTLEGTDGSLVLREWDAKNLAWALAGEEVELTATGGTVSAESVILVDGEWVRLSKRNVSLVVITGSVENTDFEVNEALGLIKMITGGNLTEGTNDVDFSFAAESGYRVNIGTQAQIRVALMLDGENEIDSSPVQGEFDSVVLASSAEINLISDPSTEYEELPFTLVFETLTGQSSPGRLNGVAL